MDDTDTFYTYEETKEGTTFWCKFDPDLIADQWINLIEDAK